MPDYKALVGLTYAGKRAEAGDVVSDLPSRSVPWLVEQGLIEPTDGKRAEIKLAKKREPQSPSKGDE